jgi:hypothetical protein
VPRDPEWGGLPFGRLTSNFHLVLRDSVEVPAGVPIERVGRAVALLRQAGTSVILREVPAGPLPGAWVHVAAADARRARELLILHAFPVPTPLVPRVEADDGPPGRAPGDDIWALFALGALLSCRSSGDLSLCG